jgi:hypothetical protein
MYFVDVVDDGRLFDVVVCGVLIFWMVSNCSTNDVIGLMCDVDDNVFVGGDCWWLSMVIVD